MEPLAFTLALIAALIFVWRRTRPVIVWINNRSPLALDSLGLDVRDVWRRIRG